MAGFLACVFVRVITAVPEPLFPGSPFRGSRAARVSCRAIAAHGGSPAGRGSARPSPPFIDAQNEILPNVTLPRPCPRTLHVVRRKLLVRGHPYLGPARFGRDRRTDRSESHIRRVREQFNASQATCQ